MRSTALALVVGLLAPLPVHAAGGGDPEPPKTTQTSEDCKRGQIWDEKTKTCADAEESRFDDDTRYRAVRELAWAGQPERALLVLASMREGETDRVLTYLGFANRKAGHVEEGLAQYERALVQNPDNLLARSYLGQLYVEMAEIELASLQLDEIHRRGGSGSWPERALAHAIKTGETLNY